MSTADEVIATIQAVTGEMEVQVNRELPLFELQLLDSLQTVELLVALCERFHVDVALSEIDRDAWATPARIVAFMEQRVGG